MSLAVKPIECPGGCLGCFEKDIRESGGAPAFDIEKVLASLAGQMAKDTNNSWNSPTLHGGEPLTIPIDGIERILKLIFDKYGRSGIQTSGALVTPAHIEIFKKYNTCVGVSIDGDRAETNAGRWNAPGFNAAEMTDRTIYAMQLMKEAGLSMSSITVLRRCNAGTAALRSDLVRFGLRMQDEFGITSARFNPLIAFDERTKQEEELGNEALADTLRWLAIKTFAKNLQWRPMLDFAAVLRGEQVECVFSECDPWATEAEIPILGDGSLGVCLKGGGGLDGVATLRVEKSRARYEALAQVSQGAGGCKGCFWWPYCKGGCPGAGIDSDWRNRTRFCAAYKETFTFISGLSLFEAKSCNGKQAPGGHGDKEHGDSNDPAWRKAHPEWKGVVK
jgi:uncharacterized protein